MENQEDMDVVVEDVYVINRLGLNKFVIPKDIVKINTTIVTMAQAMEVGAWVQEGLMEALDLLF